MSLPRCGLMSPSPERPCDDVGGLDAFLSEADGDASDFLHRPTDQRRREVFAALRSVFGGVVMFARCRIAAIMAKASMTSET